MRCLPNEKLEWEKKQRNKEKLHFWLHMTFITGCVVFAITELF